MSSDVIPSDNDVLAECEPSIREMYDACHKDAPNYGVSFDCFKDSLHKSIRKFSAGSLNETAPTVSEIKDFITSIQCQDLFLALACAYGNERAWWEFDQNHRSYLERVAAHLASTDADAQEVVDFVYVELYGTRLINGERVSKFANFSGRGSLRGWLRTIVWHSLVDMHRTGHNEISLDAMTENVGEGFTQASFAEPALDGEVEMLDQITHERYRRQTLSAIENAFSTLDDHEKLLLLYYHVEGLKLREIAKSVENPHSPLRNWFQRRSSQREGNPEAKIHESTIMRWLEKTYAKVMKSFRSHLLSENGLKEAELELCMEIATQDLGNSNIYRSLKTT